jgi:diguanylate cyclase (GGDEF)-like protein
MKLIPLTAPANCAFALFAAWAFYDITPVIALAVGVVAVFVIETTTLLHWLRKRPLDTPIAASDLAWVSIRAWLLAAAMAAPTIYWFPRVSPDAQLMIASIVSALIGIGAFVLSPIAIAALGWVVVLTLCACAALALAGGSTFHQLMGLLVGYAVIMNVVVITSARTLVARVRAEAHADRQREVVDLLLKDFEGSARDWLWETDTRGKLRHVSARLVEMFGQPKEALEDMLLVDLLRNSFLSASSEESEAHDVLQLRLSARKAFRDQVVPVFVNRSLRWWSLTAKPLFGRSGAQIGWRGVGSDITDAQRRDIEMTQLANFDSLTGLANRHQFQACLDAALKEPPAEGDKKNTPAEPPKLLLMVLDLDNFKTINDTLGHLIGDELLRAIAQRLQGVVSEDEMLCRLGGDEYALVVPGNNDEASCFAHGQLLLETIREPFDIRGNRIEVRGSVGVACAPQHGSTSEQLLKAADTALYASKDAGRDGVSIFSGDMEQRALQRASVQNELGRALEKNEMELHYQPQVDSRTLEVVGFEALLRWRRGHKRLVSPSHFIPIAEETGLIIPIGTWALQRACHDVARWPEPLFVAVNFSAMQFASRGLITTIREALEAANVKPVRVEIEITESSLIEDSQHARDTLKKLRAIGHRVALDDFGTGYSSLAYLRSFPIDKLKIDGAFTAGLHDDETGEASAIVRAIIQLASALKLKTTAEGVETHAQLDLLRAKGCAQFQGYYFAQPMPAEEIPAFLEAWEDERHMLLRDVQNADSFA